MSSLRRGDVTRGWLVYVYLCNVSLSLVPFLFANKIKIALSINKLAAEDTTDLF